MTGICYTNFNYGVKKSFVRIFFSSEGFKFFMTELSLCMQYTSHACGGCGDKVPYVLILAHDGGEWSPATAPRERAPVTHFIAVLPF